MSKKQYSKWQLLTAGGIGALSAIICLFAIALISSNNSNYDEALAAPTEAVTDAAEDTATSPVESDTPTAQPESTPESKTEPVTPAPASFSNPIAELDEAEVTKTIKDEAKSHWGTDYEMVQYQIENETKAYNELKNLDITSDVQESILNQAHSKWGSDFEMVQYEYNNQMEAYNKIK